MNTTELNELLPDLSDSAVTVVIGSVARDLFDRPSATGDRTYAAAGHFWTGHDSWDSVDLCGDDCVTAWAASVPWPVEVESDVEYRWQGYSVRTFLDPETSTDAVCYPFDYSDRNPGESVTCAMCGRLMVADLGAAWFVQAAVRQYLNTALWSTVASEPGDDDGDDPRPLDENHDIDDIDGDTLAEMTGDVARFVAENWSDVRDLPAGQVGHDFWLTRERHGAGFWDRGLGEVGDRLTEAAHAYGSYDLYVGDDGAIYG